MREYLKKAPPKAAAEGAEGEKKADAAAPAAKAAPADKKK